VTGNFKKHCLKWGALVVSAGSKKKMKYLTLKMRHLKVNFQVVRVFVWETLNTQHQPRKAMLRMLKASLET